ncbi:hypothetical protein DIT68_03800 [Brumimicrobium oceani]|uniref:Uncharacterized protein n=1 Tax=Brumimicrobium oceani TaxID=2100725 RepID=A0A2U2XF06_9FLAO|nr:hypothetical protein DIT68_03800 [Brumimicrobium oceani]
MDFTENSTEESQSFAKEIEEIRLLKGSLFKESYPLNFASKLITHPLPCLVLQRNADDVSLLETQTFVDFHLN